MFVEISAENESPYAQPIVNSLDSFFEDTQTKKRIKKKEKTEKTVSCFLYSEHPKVIFYSTCKLRVWKQGPGASKKFRLLLT